MRETVIDFVRTANQDPRLWREIANAKTAADLVKAGSGAGYKFTTEDVEDLQKQISQAEECEKPELGAPRRRLPHTVVAAGLLATSDVCTENNGGPITCIVWPATFVDDTCNCTVFQPGCD